MFHLLLLAGSKENSLHYLSAWKNNLQVDISVVDWEETHLLAQTQTNTRCELLQYKWLHRTYITPVKLHLIIVLNVIEKLVPCFIVCCISEAPKVQERGSWHKQMFQLKFYIP